MSGPHIAGLGVLVVAALPGGGGARAGGSPVRAPSEATVLDTLREGHPRLILTEERLDEIKRASARDAVLKRAIESAIRYADKRAKMPPLVHKLKGPRLLHVSRDCLDRIYALGLAWRLTGRKDYAQRARRELLTVCAFKDWNPSHFLDTAEMSHAVGVGYDWLYPFLSEGDRGKIRAGLVKLGMGPGLKGYGVTGGRTAWWVRSAFNWNQVCNGGLVIGALAIADTDPQYARQMVPRAVKSLPVAMASYAPDGAWGEGPGYWYYATRYTVYGIEAMRTSLGTDFGLTELPGFLEAGLFPLSASGPSRMYLTYADVGENASRRNLPPFFWFARNAGHDLLAAAEIDMMKERGAQPLDVIWYHPPGARKAASLPHDRLPLDRLFRGVVEVAVMRSAWDDERALFAGIKAGYNQVNHGHLDLGAFEFEALGVRWARDLGSDNYNLPGYWSKGRGGKRWQYYRLNSFSHNVPLLDDENQDPYGKSRMVRFEGAPERSRRPPASHGAFAVVDFTSAYPKKAAKAVRGLKVLPGRRAVIIQDEFVLKQTCEFAWGMTTSAKIETRGPGVTLTQSGKKCLVRILAPGNAEFTVESAEQKPPQKTNKGVSRLMIRLKDRKGPVTVAVLMAPEWPGGGRLVLPKVVPLAEWKLP